MSLGRYDVAIVGAGAAGMLCAAMAGQRGRSVVLIDHWARPAEKVRISGGGRCNFTNTGSTAENFLSANPDFCRHALSAYTPGDFLALVRRHHIAFHEKHRGQLFCDGSSEAIITMLRTECEVGRVQWRVPCAITGIEPDPVGYRLATDHGAIAASNLVIASGGLSIPKIGASDFGYRVARQFGLPVIEPRPALVPLTFASTDWNAFIPLAGISLPVAIETEALKGVDGPSGPAARFEEDLLFTHRGLSGPAVLQISSYWQPGVPLRIDLAPDEPLAKSLRHAKDHSRQELGNVLAQWLPRRLVAGWVGSQMSAGGELLGRKIAELSNKTVDQIAISLKRWEIVPNGTEGFRKAEVTVGGVDTRALSPRSMEALEQRGLYFIGEVVDVTGWLGGYNFQWAWSSAAAAARAL